MYSKYRSTTKTSNKKKYIIITAALIVLFLLALAIMEATGRTNLFLNQENSSDNEQLQEESFSKPPTDEEAEAGDEVPLKQDTVIPDEEDSTTDNSQNDNSSNRAEKVALVISNAGVYDGMVEVSAFTPEAIANGKCVYTFTSGSYTITKINLARADASSTICVDKPFPVSELSASDEWGVGITYTSDSGKYTGTQQTVLEL